MREKNAIQAGRRGRVSAIRSSRGVKAVVTRTASQAAASSDGSFPVVGIGASAGGLEAATELLKNLPQEPGLAFVVVQHLDPTH